MILDRNFLEESSKIAEIITSICAIIGLTIWKWAFLKLKILNLGWLNIYQREKWIWNAVSNGRFGSTYKNPFQAGIFGKEARTSRKMWNKCHNKLGVLKEDTSMDKRCYFSNFGRYGEEHRHKIHKMTFPISLNK